MCLAALSIVQHPRFVWVLASNRDEFHDRPALPMQWWQADDDGPMLLGGRDLSAGGTWLGLTAAGHLALVTNVREPGRFQAGLASRGDLVPQWLRSPGFAAHELLRLASEPRNGFNLLVSDLRDGRSAWLGNRGSSAASPPPVVARAGAPTESRTEPQTRLLGEGLIGLSNALLDTPWPKVQRLKQRLGLAVATAGDVADLVGAAMAALADRSEATDDRLPSTGVPLERERQLSPAFIHIPGRDGVAAYGTRCSTVVVVEQTPAGRVVHLHEQRFSPQAEPAGRSNFRFSLPI